MNLFLEKCEDALDRSAFFFKKESFWGFEPIKKYCSFLYTKRSSGTADVIFLPVYLAIPVVLAIIPPIINLVFNVTAAALNLIIVPILTVIHILKSALRMDIEKVIKDMDQGTFRDACEKLSEYEPKSKASSEFRTKMLETDTRSESGMIAAKTDAIYFFRHPSHNAGRDIAKCFFGAAAEKAKADQQRMQDEETKRELDSIADGIRNKA